MRNLSRNITTTFDVKDIEEKMWYNELKRIEASVWSISNTKRLLAWCQSTKKKTRGENNTSAVCRWTHISIYQQTISCRCWNDTGKNKLSTAISAAFSSTLVNDSCWFLYSYRHGNARKQKCSRFCIHNKDNDDSHNNRTRYSLWGRCFFSGFFSLARSCSLFFQIIVFNFLPSHIFCSAFILISFWLRKSTHT